VSAFRSRLLGFLACLAVLRAGAGPGVAQRYPALAVREPIVTPGRTPLSCGWLLQNETLVTDGPESISSAGFDPEGWLPARVPGTVLASYRACGAVPDLNYGDQQTLIDDDFFTRHDFWYRLAFVVDPRCQGRRLALIFDGINWKADVFLNGAGIGHVAGAFVRARFDITDIARCGGTNYLAVRVRRVAHPGVPRRKRLGQQYPNGGELGLDSPTFVSSIGWNWLPTIPGRNIGIWNDVWIETSGDVVLIDPWISADLSSNNTRADLDLRTELRNLTGKPADCVLAFDWNGAAFRRPFQLQPHETRAVRLESVDCPGLSLSRPRLWWPNGYGPQHLYTMRLRVESGGAASDERDVRFGVRKLECRMQRGSLYLYVNGARIVCRGGNWGMDDALLDCDRAGYDLRMHRDLHLVMIRNWVGMTGKEAFYDACDRYGLLVWDDFWLANPSDGPDPEDHAMFLNNARDKVRRVRGHPCLALYCGRNEGDPPADLDKGLREAVSSLDGTRLYLPHSAAGGVTGFGPYDVQDPEWYFAHRGATFHSELGIVCVPPVESMRAMMPADRLWPINDMWAIHDYQTPRAPLYTRRLAQRYGPPDSLEDYCRKAQMVNFETARAMYECLQSRQGGGLLVWMTQPAWPSLICQLYDYFFEPTAAYFGAKHACEPLHILWDQHARRVKVANDTVSDCVGLKAEAEVYDLNGRERWRAAIGLDVPATSARDCFSLDAPSEMGGVYFVRLRLRRADTVLSENFYWSTRSGDCRGLNALPRVRLSLTAALRATPGGFSLRATVSNPSAAVALAIRLKLLRDRSRERVLPAFYEDNYFALLPGESRAVTVAFSRDALAGEKPRLAVEGWNIQPANIPVD
jgi:hypothetical protein